MGNFYVNFSVRTTDRAIIVEILQAAHRIAFVSPSIDGYVAVFDQETDQQMLASILDLGEQLSTAANGPVLAVLNHDDDVLLYWLFAAGELIDEYCSDPAYQGIDEANEYDEVQPPTRSDVGRLCHVLGVPDAQTEVSTILFESSYVFALDQHQALALVLGLPLCTVGFGFTYIDEEPDDSQLSPGVSKADLLRVG